MSRFWKVYDLSLKLIAAGLMLGITVVASMQVFFRYVLQDSLSWTEEASRYLMIWLVFLVAAAEVERLSHITVDIAIQRLSNVQREYLNKLSLVLILGIALILIVQGYILTERSMGQQTAMLPVTMGIVYLCVPIGGIIMAISAIRVLVRGPAAVGDGQPGTGGDV